MKCKKCKKVKYIMLDCKCKEKYCIKHLNNHSCQYDYKKDKEKLKNDNPKIVSEKIPLI